MAIFTNESRHTKALMWKQKLAAAGGVWFGFGRTTPWPDENDPPVPDPTATGVEEVIGYKKYDMLTFVKRDDAGTIVYLGERYSPISDEDASAEGAMLLYIRAIYDYGDLPEEDTRQIGLFYGLVIKEEISQDLEAVTPDQIETPGHMFVLDNTVVNSRVSYQRDEYAYMLLF